MDVGRRIVQLRQDRGITTNRLANVAGISQSYLREVELGNKNPTVEMLGYICDGLNISLIDFFDCKQKEEIEPSLKKEIQSLSKDAQLKLAEFLHTIDTK